MSKEVGFVVGAQSGEGALRGDGKTVDYCKMEPGQRASRRVKSSVFVFAYGKEGLMGGWSVKGTKFTKRKAKSVVTGVGWLAWR